MQEIEIKFKIDNINQLKTKLMNLGCVFSTELNQKDVVFVPNINDTSNGEGKIFIRVRSTNDKAKLTLKKQTKKIMESKEIEFGISDFDSAYDFLNTLGLQKWVVIEKKRITTEYKNFNICIDEVKRLGGFVEIEIVTPEINKTEYYEEKIIDIAKELGINHENRINSFYDTMISELDNR